MSVSFRRIAAFVLSSLLFFISSAQAVNLSQQQIEAFKKLPLSQQKALAKQYGVDLSTLQPTQNVTQSQEDGEQNYLMPRKQDDNQTQYVDFDAQFAPKDKKLKRFGLDLFAGEPTTYMPLNNVPVPSDYIVGPGDSFKVMLYGKVSNEYDLQVSRDGMLIIPDLSPIAVTGMSFKEVKALVENEVSSKMIGVKASVGMGQLRSIRIFVLGEAYKPGAYSVSSLSTITHALIASGGISDIGSLRKIQLKRTGKVVSQLDLYDLLIRGDNTKDVVLQANDVVFIPAAGDLVTVSGQVRREAIYEMKQNETYADLIQMAGGLVSTAYPKDSLVERFNGGNLRTLVNLDLSNANVLHDKPVNGDKITVPAVSEQYKDVVSLIGAVARPGKMQWRKGMRVSDLIKSIHGDLLNIADMDYALVVREINNRGDIKVMQFKPRLAVVHQPGEDFELQPRDKVVVFSRFETIEAENRMLEKYAYTETEIDERQQQHLWQQYQKQKFMDYIGINSDDSRSKDELNKKEFDSANKSLMDLTAEQSDKGIKEEDYSLFSRRRLLAPIILQLREQADVKNPVGLVEIDGNVKYPGVYPLPQDGHLSQLLTAAGGVLESAYLERAEVTRLIPEQASTTIKHLHSNLKNALADTNCADNLVLKSKDRLNVLAIPNWQENITVKLSGEVKFPGVYTIRRGEVLSSVIERAGGFTRFSAPKAAVFSRASLRRKERQYLDKLSEDLKRSIAAKSFQNNGDNTAVSYNETKQLLNDLSKVKAVGRLVIDLDKVVNKSADVQLENGDALYVPPLVQSVNVIGEVNVATAHMYDPNISVKEYIAKSGGFKQRADEERVYIIKADGSVVIPEKNDWFAVNYDVQLESGDTIVVPLDTEHMDNLTLYSTATQIIYQLGVAVAAIGSL